MRMSLPRWTALPIRQETSIKRNSGNLFAEAQKSFLQPDIVSFGVIGVFCLMMKISTAYVCASLVADSKPHLRLKSFSQIVRCTLASHLCGDPTWINCIRANVWPSPCDGLAKH